MSSSQLKTPFFVRYEFGSTLGLPNVSKLEASQQEIDSCITFIQLHVKEVSQVMTYPEVLNVVLPENLQFPVYSASDFEPPAHDLDLLAAVGVLYLADASGWAAGLNVTSFISDQFPGLPMEHALQQMAAWAENPCQAGRCLEVWSEDGSSTTISLRLRPATFLMTLSRLQSSFGGCADDSGMRWVMRCPRLIQQIITLLPPHWAEFYVVVSDNSQSYQVLGWSENVAGDVDMQDQLRSAAAEQSTDEGYKAGIPGPEAYKQNKPLFPLQVLIGLVLALRKVRYILDNRTEQLAAKTDWMLNQYMLSDKFTLADCLEWLVEDFRYYQSNEEQKEFLLQVKSEEDTINQFFDRHTNYGHCMYSLKKKECPNIFQSILLIALDKENSANLLHQPDYLDTIVATRLPLSDTLLFASALLELGNAEQRHAVPIKDQLIPHALNKLRYADGFRELRGWYSADRMEQYLVTLLTDLIDFDFFRIYDKTCLVFQSEVDVRQVRVEILEMLDRLREFEVCADFVEVFSGQLRLEKKIVSCHPNPHMPPDYLIGLAILNLATSPGSPVAYTRLWKFIATEFPFFKDKTPWTQEEIVAGSKKPGRFVNAIEVFFFIYAEHLYK